MPPGAGFALSVSAINVQVAVLARANLRGKLAAALAAWGACLIWPHDGVAVLSVATGCAINVGLLAVFAASLLPGRVAVATGFAHRIHGGLTLRRRDYTRAVTWLWAVFFALELCVCILRGAVPAVVGGPLLGNVSELPLAACLFGAEFLVRSCWFRGERRGSLGDMLRAYRARAGAAAQERAAP